jgi:hypothetical protein
MFACLNLWAKGCWQSSQTESRITTSLSFAGRRIPPANPVSILEKAWDQEKLCGATAGSNRPSQQFSWLLPQELHVDWHVPHR